MMEKLFKGKVLGEKDDWEVHFIGYSDYEWDEEDDDYDIHWQEFGWVLQEFIRQGIGIGQISWHKPAEDVYFSVLVDMEKGGLHIVKNDLSRVFEFLFWDESDEEVTDEEF
jgi:hypothetical protein